MISRLILFFIWLCLVPFAHGKSYSSAVLAEYQYNPLGQLIEAYTPARQLCWEYDALGRVTQDWQDDYCLTHEYLANGLRKQTQANQGYAIGYGYDELGRFNSLSCQGHQLTAIQYDVMGREVHRALDNHTSYSQQFDPQGRRLVKQQLSKQTSLLNQRQYHYDDNGRISQINDNLRGAQQFKYDSLDRLTSVEGFAPEKFIHDPAGNLLDNASQRLKGNQQTQYQGQYYKYDKQGNRIADHDGKQQTNYQYNELNQLVAVTNSKLQASYAYDALGRRTTKTVNGKTTQFYWDGDVLQQERCPENTKTYLFEPNSFKPFAFIQNGHAYYYHLDHLGTPQEITNDQGKIVWGAKYRVYGNVVSVLANEVENNIRFQGQYFDAETGLHYNRFRYYDPHCGRFINQDPIGLLGGLNNYQYVPNPLGWVDPWGLSAKPSDCPLSGNNWEFDPNKDVDLRGQDASYRDALDIAFDKTGVPKDQFEVTKWGHDKNGKSIPVEYSAPNGANVNMDIPEFNNVKTNGSLGEGPHQPHIGYQTPGKGKSRVRGHIFVNDVPATRK